MFAGITSSLQSLLAQPALLAIGAGLLAGAMTGTTLVVTGILPDRPDPELTLLSCYRDGKAVGSVQAGASMLVTARSADGQWLEVYIGVPGADRGWAPRAALKFDAAIEGLPIGECTGFIPLGSLGPPASLAPSAAPPPSGAPSAAPTIVATVGPTLKPGTTPSPTPKPTRTPKPSPTATPLPPPPTFPPTPTPLPTADVFAPSISNFTITSPTPFQGSYYTYSNHQCGQATATVHVTIIDPSGFNFVRLYYKPQLLSTTFGNMTYKGSNVWEFVITPTGSWGEGEVGLWVQAQDGHGNTTAQIPFGNPNSSADSSLFWEPFCVS